MRPNQFEFLAFAGRRRHEQINGCIIHMRQDHKLFLFSKRHEFLCNHALGIGALIQMKLANPSVSPSRCAFSVFSLHHVIDGRITKPAAVVRAVSVQANKRNNRHPCLLGQL
jgi:hypothetical protein